MKIYYYLFFKLYNFWDKISIPSFWNDFKAGVSIAALEVCLILSLINYYNIFIDRDFDLNKNVFLFIALCISVMNFKIFILSNNWKVYNKQFTQLSKKKNIIGGIVVWSVVICIITNLIYSYYLMSQINWNK